MNAAKHMEMIFLASLALVSASTLANATVPTHRAAHAAPLVSMQDSAQGRPAVAMTVVTVTAKRRSAAQKAALVN